MSHISSDMTRLALARQLRRRLYYVGDCLVYRLLAAELSHCLGLVVFKRVNDACSAPLVSALEQLYLFLHFLLVLFALLLYRHLFPLVDHKPLFELVDAEKLDEALVNGQLTPDEPLDVVA